MVAWAPLVRRRGNHLRGPSRPIFKRILRWRRGRRPIPEPPEQPRDRISDLPDGVLGDIITQLRCDEGCRAQLLKRRGRHVWRSAPLNLECGHFSGDAVSRILSSHRGPGRRLSLSEYDFNYVEDDAWLRSPALDNLLPFQF